jgi:hypothetical protein
MKNKIIVAIVLGVVILSGVFVYSNYKKPVVSNISENGSYQDMPSIEANADYGKDFKVYTSPLGFSFKYPPHMRVMEDPDAPRVYVVTDVPKGEPFSAIVVSAGGNDENQTPEEWLLGDSSGYLQSQEHYGDYHKTQIDGQNAVYTEGGMWSVVNTPDNKVRLSIAYTAGEGADIPFTEMGIVVESLAFVR